MQHGGKFLCIELQPLRSQTGTLAERLLFLILIFELCKGLMRPLHRHLARACTIELFHDPFDKFGLIESGIDNDPLSALDVDPRLGKQFCIALELQFIHIDPP